MEESEEAKPVMPIKSEEHKSVTPAKRKAESELSSNPNTVKSRARFDALNSERQEYDRARRAMNTAVSRARDKVKLEPSYRNATTAEQEAMLEETKLQVQRKRYTDGTHPDLIAQKYDLAPNDWDQTPPEYLEILEENDEGENAEWHGANQALDDMEDLRRTRSDSQVKLLNLQYAFFSLPADISEQDQLCLVASHLAPGCEDWESKPQLAQDVKRTVDELNEMSTYARSAALQKQTFLPDSGTLLQIYKCFKLEIGDWRSHLDNLFWKIYLKRYHPSRLEAYVAVMASMEATTYTVHVPQDLPYIAHRNKKKFPHPLRSKALYAIKMSVQHTEAWNKRYGDSKEPSGFAFMFPAVKSANATRLCSAISVGEVAVYRAMLAQTAIGLQLAELDSTYVRAREIIRNMKAQRLARRGALLWPRRPSWNPNRARESPFINRQRITRRFSIKRKMAEIVGMGTLNYGQHMDEGWDNLPGSLQDWKDIPDDLLSRPNVFFPETSRYTDEQQAMALSLIGQPYVKNFKPKIADRLVPAWSKESRKQKSWMLNGPTDSRLGTTLAIGDNDVDTKVLVGTFDPLAIGEKKKKRVVRFRS